MKALAPSHGSADFLDCGRPRSRARSSRDDQKRKRSFSRAVSGEIYGIPIVSFDGSPDDESRPTVDQILAPFRMTR
jgi:hypothetical protein